MSSEEERPQILDTETESEILYGRLCGKASRAVGATLRGGAHADDVAVIAVTEILRSLRVLSARQLAVLLSAEAKRGERHVIHEPPRYTAEEIADVS